MTEFEMKTKVFKVGTKRVQLGTCRDCGLHFYSMEHLSKDQIDFLRKNVGNEVKVTMEYDPWHSDAKCYWKPVKVEKA